MFMTPQKFSSALFLQHVISRKILLVTLFRKLNLVSGDSVTLKIVTQHPL
jgi:hypothetical protein